ncbi:MAG: cobalamin biosynthesis protein [Alphaproteobacteria bacterium]
MSPESLIILLVAMALDFYLGAPIRRRGWRWHPQTALTCLAQWCDARLNRRTARARAVRGALALAILGLAAGAVGFGFDRLAASDPLMVILVLVLVTALIDQREAYLALVELGRCLAARDRACAEAALAVLTPRDPVHLDDYALVRVGIEAAADNFVRQWVAPILAYVVFGVAGMLVWWLVLTLCRVAGGRDPEHSAFGAPIRAALALLAFVPVRLAGGLLAFAAAGTDGGIAGALGVVRRNKGIAWPEAALAGALDLALGGPRRYTARVVDSPWIGGGRARAKPGDITAAARLIARATLLAAVLVLLALGVGLAT